MVDKYVNFRANEVKQGLGDPEAGLEAAKLMRKAAALGKHTMGGLPPKKDEQIDAQGQIARAEFDQRIKDESESSGS